MAENTLMKELGGFVGEQFASILGGATANYNSLGKLETLIKNLDELVQGSDMGGDLDTLTEISAFLVLHKDKILAIANKLDKVNVVNNLTTSNDAAGQTKALAAPQGKILKDALDSLTNSLNSKANTADVINKTALGTLVEFTTAFTQSSGV